MCNDPLVQLKNLGKTFYTPRGPHAAFKNINLSIYKGEILALVGESGCGKSTLGKTVLSLEKASHGAVHFDGIDLSHLPSMQLRKMRKRMQIVFQNPAGSLSPRMTVKDLLEEARDIHSLPRFVVQELLARVGLEEGILQRYPHELSGGQCQRVSIARALAVEPDFLIFDEPLSALDMLIRKQVLTLLKDLQKNSNLTYLFITHDLATLKTFADRIAVMYMGQIVEVGTTYEILNHPKNPYTQALISRIPKRS